MQSPAAVMRIAKEPCSKAQRVSIDPLPYNVPVGSIQPKFRNSEIVLVVVLVLVLDLVGFSTSK